MALRKPIGAEALDLLEATRGGVGIVAARDHAADELVAEGVDGAEPLEGRHGAAPAVGLGRRQAGGDDGDQPRLLLEQNRTSAVWGKRVSVRVDHDGRRLIKNKSITKDTK